MLPVFFLKSVLKIFNEFSWVAPGAALEEECLRRGAGLLIKLPYIARNAPTPRGSFSPVSPRFGIHDCGGEPWSKDYDPRPMRKWQCTYLRDRFRAAPYHGTVHSLRHSLVQIHARMIETGHEDSLSQQPGSIDLLQLLHHLSSYLD